MLALADARLAGRCLQDGRQERVGALDQLLEQHVLPGRIEQLPDDGPRKVAIGLLDQPAILGTKKNLFAIVISF